MEILKSASKLVFLIMAVGATIALFSNFITGEQFLILASMAFSFYFSNKGEGDKKYAGK